MEKLLRIFSIIILSLPFGIAFLPPQPANADVTTNTLTAAMTDSLDTLNPFAVNSDMAYLGLIYEPLVLGLEDGSFGPSLAENWSISVDGLEWTFNLDPDATWSDGEPVTADDVVFTYELHFENTGFVQSSSIRALVKQDAGEPAADAIIKVDTDTVKFTLSDTYGTFLTSISSVFICPQHIWQPIIDTEDITTYEPKDQSQATIASQLIGSGPFTVGEYVDNQYMSFDANLNYWKGIVSSMDEVVFEVYADYEAALLALKSGDVDCLPWVNPEDVSSLLEDPDIEVDILTTNHTAMLFLNMRKPPLHILEVRKAIDMTIDRQDLINSATYGYGSLPQQVPFAGGLAESNPDIAWVDQYVDGEGDLLSQTIRVANANTLLDAIPGMSAYVEGETRIWTDPVTSLEFDMEFDFNYIDDPTYQRGATEITKTLEDIGITLNPGPFAGGMFGPTLFSGMMVWNYDFVIFGYPSKPEFDQLVKQWSNSPFGGNYSGSVVGFNNNKADPYVDNGVDKPGDPEGAKPQTYDTPDWDTATADEKALYKSIYDGIVAWAIPIEEDLYATKLMTDPVARLAAIMDVQQDFMEELPVINLYHDYFLSAYRTDGFQWPEEMTAVYYVRSGVISPVISVATYTAVDANRPDQSVNSAPADGATGISVPPTLESSAFSDPDTGDIHTASRWQVTDTSGDYSSPVYDSGADTTNLTSITVPADTLNYYTVYYWRVRPRDSRGAWSLEWSTETSFITALDIRDSDEDGLLNHEEIALGTDINKADTDMDGLSDGVERTVYNTNPLLTDTDGDGVSDGLEAVATGLTADIEALAEGWIRVNLFWSDYTMEVETSSTVLGVTFNSDSKRLSVTVSGEDDTTGECTIVIPKALVIISSDISVNLDNAPIEFTVTEDGEYYNINVEYNHSTHSLVTSWLRPSTLPVSTFIADKTSAAIQEIITFTDQSTNDPISWEWDFGDGSTSTAQNPIHVYNAVGIYTVQLTATNADGSDEEVKAEYITITNAPVTEPDTGGGGGCGASAAAASASDIVSGWGILGFLGVVGLSLHKKKKTKK